MLLRHCKLETDCKKQSVKMSRINLMTITILLSFVTYGQTRINFLNQFKSVKLPICVAYSHDEQVYFGAIYETDTIDGEAQNVFEQNENYQKDSSLLLSKEFVKQHLLPNTNFIYTLDEKSKDTLFTEPIENYLNSDFYAISSPLTTKGFYVVLYERLFTNSLLSSEKYICTFNKKGIFISRALIASFVFSGTGLSDSGVRVPWYPDESGCIRKDLTINFTSSEKGNKKYKIQSDGNIVEVK